MCDCVRGPIMIHVTTSNEYLRTRKESPSTPESCCNDHAEQAIACRADLDLFPKWGCSKLWDSQPSSISDKNIILGMRISYSPGMLGDQSARIPEGLARTPAFLGPTKPTQGFGAFEVRYRRNTTYWGRRSSWRSTHVVVWLL